MALTPYPGTDQYSTVTVGGLYDNNTESPLFAPSGTTVPTSGLAIGGSDPNGLFQVHALDQSSNSTSFPGIQFKVGTAWTSATSSGTFQYNTGTATELPVVSGAPAYLVQLNQTTTITGGVVTFQGTYDNINWVTIPTAQVLNPNTFAQLTNPYTLVASTNQPFLILSQGFIAIRADLSTVITGTGSVTPYWATLAYEPAIASSTSSTVSGTLSNNTAAPIADNVGVLPALAATSYTTNTYTNGFQVLPVTDLHGASNTDMQAVAGVALGATAVTNFGTAPAATAVPGVNANIYTAGAAIAVANTLFTQISDGTAAMGTMANFGTNPGAVKALNTNSFVYNTTAAPIFVSGTLTNNNAAPAANNLGVLPAVANAASPAWTEGDQVLLSEDLTGRMRVRGTLSTNNAAPTGDNIGVLPALVESGAFPATTLPALTAGDQALVSVTQGGSLRVIPADEANAPSINYFSADMGDTPKSVANPAILPLISVRTNSATTQFLLRGFVLQSNGTLSRWQLVKNATLTGSTFATSNGNMQIDTAATVVSGGTVVDSGYFSGNQLVKAVLYAMAAGTPGDRYTLVGSSIGGTSKISASIQWSELAAAI